MLIRNLSDKDYADVFTSDTPIILKFHAPWCGPCKATTPVIEKLADEYADKLSVCEIDVDGNPEAVQFFHVMCVPVTMFIRDGQVMDQISGFTPNFEHDVRTKIEKMLEGV